MSDERSVGLDQSQPCRRLNEDMTQSMAKMD